MAAGAAAAAAIANAIKASGVLVQIEPRDMQDLLYRMDAPLIVTTQGGVFKTKYRYLTSYKGLCFHTVSTERLHMPSGAEIVVAKSIAVPG